MKDNYEEAIFDIEGLILQLETFIGCEEVVSYRVTETFPKSGKRTYAVINLSAETENGIVTFDDVEHEISNDDTRVLNLFMIDSIESINHTFSDVTNLYTTMLIFKSGTIMIEKLK